MRLCLNAVVMSWKYKKLDPDRQIQVQLLAIDADNLEVELNALGSKITDRVRYSDAERVRLNRQYQALSRQQETLWKTIGAIYGQIK